MPSVIVCGVGTISKELIPYLLSQQYTVTVVTRNQENAVSTFGTSVTSISWDEIQNNAQNYFTDCVAVVNLARPGVDTLAHPTFAMKPEEIESEKNRFITEGEKTTKIMAELCAHYANPNTTVFINASAYDHYDVQNLDAPPLNDTDPLDTSIQPRNFYTKVIRAWEAAAQPAADKGIRIVHVGLGMISDKKSPGFKSILTLFRLGIGGPIGSGEQNIPMVSMRDAVAAIMHCIKTPNISGYVNIVGFNVKQKDLAAELAKQIDQFPASRHGWMYTILKWLPFNMWLNNIMKPEWLIKFALGTFGEELLLKNVSVTSQKLLHVGFKFHDTNVAGAVKYALAKKRNQPAYLDVPTSSYAGMDALGTGTNNNNNSNNSNNLESIPQYFPSIIENYDNDQNNNGKDPKAENEEWDDAGFTLSKN